jgi:hypothetical protein
MFLLDLDEGLVVLDGALLLVLLLRLTLLVLLLQWPTQVVCMTL